MIVTTSIVLGWATQTGVQEVVKTSIGKIVSTNWKKRFFKGKTIAEQLSQQEIYETYLEKHLYATMKMRTIHSADKDVLLDQIYHPLTITDRENKLFIENGFIHENNEITNIIGYAGQGKSTILRKIFLEALTYGNKIPFFMELRRIESDGVVKTLISILDQLRIKAEQEDIENLLESGNVLLLLDGFDEVKTEYRNQLLKEIFHLNKKYNTQIIMTSRHDTEICREAGVSNFYVEPIGQMDIISIIEKLDHYQKTDVKDYFNISEILKNNRSLIETINTPLLATLFYVCYPHLDSIPENAIDFYDRLFATLYSHHDKSKNYTREKKANLDKNQAYQCFCALCFLSIYKKQYDFTEISIVEYVQKAAQIVNINDIAVENILDDFIDITSLIQRDGYDHIIFLHKSVQEYYAAQFVRNSSTQSKSSILKGIYKSIYNGDFSLFPVIKNIYYCSRQDIIEIILIPLCNDIDFDDYQENKENLIQEYYQHIISNMTIFIEYTDDSNKNDYDFNIKKLSWESSNNKSSNNKQLLLLELLFKLSQYLMHGYIIVGYRSFDSKFIHQIHNLFFVELNDHRKYYRNLLTKLGSINSKGIFPIKIKELMPHLKNNQKDEIFYQIEKQIDQLYNDTYVQYIKEIQQEKNNLIELLHLQ